MGPIVAPKRQTITICWNVRTMLRKSETKLRGRAGKQPKWLHKTESVGQTAWRPYVPTGAMRLDDEFSHKV